LQQFVLFSGCAVVGIAGLLCRAIFWHSIGAGGE
jgi:hypothetical protein